MSSTNLAFIQPAGGLAIEPAALGELDRDLLRVAMEYMRLPEREFARALSNPVVVPAGALVFDASLQVLNLSSFQRHARDFDVKVELGHLIVASSVALDYPRGGFFICSKAGIRGQFLDLPMSNAGAPVRVLHVRGW